MSTYLCDICRIRPAVYKVRLNSDGQETNIKVCEVDYSRLSRSDAFSSAFDNFYNDEFPMYQKSFRNEREEINAADIMNKSSQEVFKLAAEVANDFGKNEIDTEHLLYALTDEDVVQEILKQFKLKPLDIKGYIDSNSPKSQKLNNYNDISLSPRIKNVIELAFTVSKDMGHSYIGPEHLLVGLAQENEGMASELLKKYGLSAESIRQQITKIVGKGAKDGKIKTESNTPNLDKYSRDMSLLAAEGKLDPVIGRSVEIETTIEILARRTKNNPVLIGEPGVGKTAIVEGLAQRIYSNKVPQILKDKRVVELNIISMVAGAKYRGEFEERINQVLDEIVEHKDKLVVFIDELHTVIGAGQSGGEGGLDISNALKPALARGELHLIGATTLNEYQKYIEKDAALERRFQPVFVPEPTEAQTIEILRGLRDKYEAHHKVKITDEAIVTAVELADRYITNRFLPDKAIDLLDQAAARVRIKSDTYDLEIKELDDEIAKIKREYDSADTHKDHKRANIIKNELAAKIKDRDRKEKSWRKQKSTTSQEVSRKNVAQIVSTITGIPSQELTAEEKTKLLNLEHKLHERVVGQDEAVIAVSDAIRLNRAGLSQANRPIASFMFLGPTGVGKTELAKALAWQVFGDDNAMVRIDMSEYMERHSVARLIGAPPGYVGYDEGGQLTEKIRRRPYSVVLFDEIEKAHSDVQNILLQMLDDGRLTDGKGRVVDFSNTIIIATSNLGSNEILSFIKLKNNPDNTSLKDVVMPLIRDYFKPEFINRWDEIIIFKPLDEKQIEMIVGLQLAKVQHTALGQNIELIIDKSLIKYFAKIGYDTEYGARELKRRIRNELENKLAKELLAGTITSKQTVIAKYSNNKIQLEKAIKQ